MLGLKPMIAGIPGGWEVWIILLIVLLLFGRRIPQVARSLGQGISQFKKGLNEPDGLLGGDDEKKDDAPKDPPPSATGDTSDAGNAGSA